MKVSDMITIMEGIKKMHGDIEIRGMCQECTRDDLNVWVLTSDSEPIANIEVSSIGDDEE